MLLSLCLFFANAGEDACWSLCQKFDAAWQKAGGSVCAMCTNSEIYPITVAIFKRSALTNSATGRNAMNLCLEEDTRKNSLHGQDFDEIAKWALTSDMLTFLYSQIAEKMENYSKKFPQIKTLLSPSRAYQDMAADLEKCHLPDDALSDLLKSLALASHEIGVLRILLFRGYINLDQALAYLSQSNMFQGENHQHFFIKNILTPVLNLYEGLMGFFNQKDINEIYATYLFSFLDRISDIKVLQQFGNKLLGMTTNKIFESGPNRHECLVDRNQKLIEAFVEEMAEYEPEEAVANYQIFLDAMLKGLAQISERYPPEFIQKNTKMLKQMKVDLEKTVEAILESHQ